MIESLAWMEGHWEGVDIRGQAEEIWMAPKDGSIVGSFRWVIEDGPHVLEFIVIEQSDEGVTLRFKHFNKDYSTWEDAPNMYRLKTIEHGRAVFQRISENDRVPEHLIYEQPDPDTLTFRGETPSKPDADPLVLHFRRVTVD